MNMNLGGCSTVPNNAIDNLFLNPETNIFSPTQSAPEVEKRQFFLNPNNTKLTKDFSVDMSEGLLQPQELPQVTNTKPVSGKEKSKNPVFREEQIKFSQNNAVTGYGIPAQTATANIGLSNNDSTVKGEYILNESGVRVARVLYTGTEENGMRKTIILDADGFVNEWTEAKGNEGKLTLREPYNANKLPPGANGVQILEDGEWLTIEGFNRVKDR